jgi:putative flippase GtrA
MKSGANVTSYFFHGKLKELSRFSIVGVLNTFMDFAVFTIFQSLLGVSYVLSQVAGYSVGITNSFIFNKNWTFNGRTANKKTAYEFIQFLSINLISLIITVLFMKLLVHDFNFNVYLSKIIVTLIAQVTNFLGYKLWVFN